MKLSQQYNSFANKFSKIQDIGENSNRYNRKVFYSHIDFIERGMKVLDLACGDGLDLAYYQKLGAKVYGLDASKKLASIARKRLPEADIRLGLFEKIPFPKNYFNAVLSKYAIQTSADMRPVFKEINRVLKSGGIMLYLVTHPFRQYFEKKKSTAGYFNKEIVTAKILNNSIKVKEPTHVMSEYLNSFLFRNFDVLSYDEKWDPSAERIGGRKYPGFLIIKAVKR